MFWENNAKIIDYHDKKNGDQSECLGKEMLISKINLKRKLNIPSFAFMRWLELWSSEKVQKCNGTTVHFGRKYEFTNVEN